MTVNNGQGVNQSVTNAAFVSKTATSGNSVTGIIELNNSSDPNSGATISNTQEKINDNSDRLDSVEAASLINFTDAVAKSADYTVLDNDDVFAVLMTAGASDRTVTLPTAADNDNRIIAIKKVDSGAGSVTIDGEGAELVDGAANFVIDRLNEEVLLICDATGWQILSHYAGEGAVELYVDTGNGHGSTNTRVRRYTNTRKDTLGNYATYSDSPTDGASVTINIAGHYEVSCGDRRISGTDAIGISVGTGSGTVNITNISYANGRRASQDISSNIQMVTRVLYLDAGDVVKPHTNSNVDDTGDNSFFSVKFISR